MGANAVIATTLTRFHKPLPPGRYALRATATAASSRTTATRSAGFTIKG